MPSVSQVTSLRTNINSFGGVPVALPSNTRVRERVASANLAGFGDNSISKFYKDLSELNQYRNAKICVTSTGIIKEYINKFRSEAQDIVSVTRDGREIPESAEINDLFRTIEFEKAFFSDKLDEYIYFGSDLFLIKIPSNNDLSEAKLDDLKYPFSSIIYRAKGKEDEIYLNGTRLVTKLDDGYYIPLRIGKLDAQLDEDGINGWYLQGDQFQNAVWKASKPLFNGLVTELKLFILKDILTNLVQIQDIVSPNLLLANVDKNTSQEKATELAEEIEKLINQYGDLTQLLSSNADVTTLSQFILNNVRVYPDMLGVIRGTDKLDFSRLTGKNNEIRSELDNTESQLVNAIGLPIDLYKGQASNKYDALKNSDRLLARVVDEMNTIDDSIIAFSRDFLEHKGVDTKGLKFDSKLFDYSFVNGINSTYKYDTAAQYLRNLTAFAGEIKQALESTADVFDTEKMYQFLASNAEIVYPGFKDLIRPDFVDTIKNKANEQSEPRDPEEGRL
jgi:hypothetical protein